MHNNAGPIISMFFFIISFFSACTPSKSNSERLSCKEGGSRPLSSYSIFPYAGWNEVTDPEQIKMRVTWIISNYNYTRWLEKPQIRVWDGPEQANTFLTVQQIKRHRNLGIGTWYDGIIRFMYEIGAKVQETGVTEIGGLRCKWWVQSFGEGQVHQHSFLFGRENYFYIFCFTTSYLSEEKKQLFENIVRTVIFEDSYTQGDGE